MWNIFSNSMPLIWLKLLYPEAGWAPIKECYGSGFLNEFDLFTLCSVGQVKQAVFNHISLHWKVLSLTRALSCFKHGLLLGNNTHMWARRAKLWSMMNMLRFKRWIVFMWDVRQRGNRENKAEVSVMAMGQYTFCAGVMVTDPIINIHEAKDALTYHSHREVRN